MIRVQFVLIYDDDTESLIDSKVFENAESRHDSTIDDYVYNKVLELDEQYDFIDYDNCPLIEIRYLDNNDKLIYTDDCVDYMYNL